MKKIVLSHRRMTQIGTPRRKDGNRMGLRLRRRVKSIVFIDPFAGFPPPDSVPTWGIAPHGSKGGPQLNEDGTEIKELGGWRMLP